MDISILFQELKDKVPELISSYGIVNKSLMKLEEIQNMGYNDFSLRAKISMPQKLYKYFRNSSTEICDEKSGETTQVNYSLEALKNNTVFMQSPSLFDDVYDSDISLDYSSYEKARLFEYCVRCNLNVQKTMTTEDLGNMLVHRIWDEANSTGSFDSLIQREPASKNEELSNQLFLNRLKIELPKSNDLGVAVRTAIVKEFESYSKFLRNIFRISCFTTTPYSQLMWATYADCHKGFCVEYTVLPNESQYQNQFLNLFPMIYCTVRPDMTERLIEFQEKEPTEDLLWDIYFHGVLRKSIDWAFQNEWRLLLPLADGKPVSDYNVPFFPITKVFLGNRMPLEERKKVISICHDRNIPYVGVTRNSNFFEMKDCDIRCEDCPKFQLS